MSPDQIKDLANTIIAASESAALSTPHAVAGDVRDDIEIITGAEMDAIEAAAIAGNPLTAISSTVTGTREDVAQAIKSLHHVANEWADAATNGQQWLRNIVDGISTPAEALENMNGNIAHCVSVRDAAMSLSAILSLLNGTGLVQQRACIDGPSVAESDETKSDAERLHGIYDGNGRRRDRGGFCA